MDAESTRQAVVLENAHHSQPVGRASGAELNARITLAGLPAAKVYGGTSRVTTEHAPITAPSPMETPFRMLTLNPIQALSLTTTGACAIRCRFFRPTSPSRKSVPRSIPP